MRNAKSDKAKSIISLSIASLARADSPDTVRPLIAGEINMAYKLELLTYAERDNLLNEMVAACARRRDELRRVRHQQLAEQHKARTARRGEA